MIVDATGSLERHAIVVIVVHEVVVGELSVEFLVGLISCFF